VETLIIIFFEKNFKIRGLEIDYINLWKLQGQLNKIYKLNILEFFDNVLHIEVYLGSFIEVRLLIPVCWTPFIEFHLFIQYSNHIKKIIKNRVINRFYWNFFVRQEIKSSKKLLYASILCLWVNTHQNENSCKKGN